ncbi:MAG: helix-turn-helix transcriptional regulator [Clostridium lundense]|nr:helix-turn-helix transcriptional regulator [Clostridium lundense]
MLSAEKLKYLRLLHGLTQKDVADAMGVKRNYISMLENRKQNMSQEWHDKYVATIYKVAEEKKKQQNVEEIAEDIAKEVKTKTTKTTTKNTKQNA